MKPDFEGHANQFFRSMLKKVMEFGVVATPRGRRTRELLHQVTWLPDPRKRVLTIGNRRANPFFSIAETVWILAGASDAEWILHFNKKLEAFLDPGEEQHFHAPYGERMRHYGFNNKMHLGSPEGGVDQIPAVIEEIRRDPETRRAVMIYGNPIFDRLEYKTLDRPCNVAFAFKLRSGLLHMTTFNRSNDVVLGLTFTNIVQFTTIQEVIAASLGVDVGPYIHYSDSLHVYEDDAKKVDAWISDSAWGDFDIYKYVKPTPMMLHPEAYRFAESLYKWTLTDRQNRLFSHIECPYWRSAALMIQAWDKLQKFGPLAPYTHIDALDLIEKIPALDWKVAALEFLVRWAQNREKYINLAQFEHVISLTVDLLPIDVVGWIFHSRTV